jgi:Bacterial Ig-like domain (group 1).
VALVPSKLTLQASPTASGPNSGTATSQQARLVATVVDANANPVSGATVNFTRLVDPSGGNLSQPSALTDSSGQASVQYIAGGSTTASNGVQLQAQVSGTSVLGTANLTVNQSALFIALGTGNVISNLDPQTYQKDWVVYVTDSNGIAVPNITLTIKVLPLAYGKGQLTFNTNVWVYAPGAIFCPNEDDGGTTGIASNAYNGVLDAGEDRNGDGRLQPGNVISVTAAGGTGGASSEPSRPIPRAAQRSR